MILAEVDWVIFIIALVIAIIIVTIVCWLGRIERPYDDVAQRFGGIVGFFLYRCFCLKKNTKQDEKEQEETEAGRSETETKGDIE